MNASKPNQTALSMFCANEETWVDMIPQFGLDERTTLLNGSHIGPWQAGWSTRVPLWLARNLQTKSLGRIAPNGEINNWMQVDLLKQILQHEKTNQSFWTNVAKVDSYGNHENDTGKPYLPERYWELSQCFSTADNPAAVSLLLQDIWTVRLDKLRLQFEAVFAEKDHVKAVNVPGIGTAEMAVMKNVVADLLSEKVKLQRNASLPEQGKGVQTPAA
eukprot:CAMPEP_0198147600 /NCGR_PEP_ID=MMETSP1443-20131203/36876_1 /TAXON_ID=186043 /ORGANISM="Entomoneis sp., Strain CCMP2396" /LENGTH=216 /DNA_ID=CAMNT_0043812009 /DNA_START=78 /DNA_END=725 /DNA_ORIENTATION=+